MDVLSFVLGVKKGEKSANMDEIDDALDAINGEVVGESLFTVTFLNTDGTLLWQTEVFDGNSCEDPVTSGAIDTPTRESTKYLNYTYSGWSLTNEGSADSTVLSKITANTTVYAAYKSSYIYLAQGYCGEENYDNGKDVSWTINPDYVLAITGKAVTSTGLVAGTKTTLNGDKCPWKDYRTLITEVKTLRVRSIGAYAFDGCTSLSKVTLDNSIQWWLEGTFNNCTNLKTIYIPASMVVIGNHSFAGSGLTSATFGKTDNWRLNDQETGELIPQADLNNPTTAAIHLTQTYVSERWSRKPS